MKKYSGPRAGVSRVRDQESTAVRQAAGVAGVILRVGPKGLLDLPHALPGGVPVGSREAMAGAEPGVEWGS